ncbi:MAG: hypothetical protein COB66_01020 [Coxiella sp. (in: Bacteria)]|nr:MAG: hypothetical protein COB66_01020 [Coxiella sp. (in: g-proteobacteria)]
MTFKEIVGYGTVGAREALTGKFKTAEGFAPIINAALGTTSGWGAGDKRAKAVSDVLMPRLRKLRFEYIPQDEPKSLLHDLIYRILHKLIYNPDLFKGDDAPCNVSGAHIRRSYSFSLALELILFAEHILTIEINMENLLDNVATLLGTINGYITSSSLNLSNPFDSFIYGIVKRLLADGCSMAFREYEEIVRVEPSIELVFESYLERLYQQYDSSKQAKKITVLEETVLSQSAELRQLYKRMDKVDALLRRLELSVTAEKKSPALF